MCAPDGTWPNEVRDHAPEVHMQLVRPSSQASDGVQVGFSLLARPALPPIVALARAAQLRLAREAATSKAAAAHCA
jgi:hypothetical protein